MTKEELLLALKNTKAESDVEISHYRADMLLLSYINDEDIRRAFLSVPRWYA